MRFVLSTLAVLLVATACSPPPSQPAEDSLSASSTTLGFDIALTFSPAARAKLGEIKEKVNVAAMYWGEPTDKAASIADEMGQIDLGRDDVMVEPADQTVHVAGTGLKTASLADITSTPYVLVNIYTARTVNPDNLLDCGFFEGPISPATTAAIHCKLIGEE
ncbi:hypothetical protein [Asticcacaulis sp. AC402]|uniref:hypothetical protein n=1 Tax=Asticcacaulis sp. AC402 TaxID=1282361 RepID=UPI0003C3E4A4|nr:hypothetical protein [Asticcacaulis sp. AC402]ESQ75514.1 hypothetical protein ABAC402_08290 [Asticcacaulis sp. AC402]